MSREQVTDAIETIIKTLDSAISDLSLLSKSELGGVHFNEAIEAQSLIRKAANILSEVKETNCLHFRFHRCMLCDAINKDSFESRLTINRDLDVSVCPKCYSVISRFRFISAQSAGRHVTERKSKASVENGKLGGRPKGVKNK